jgi:hypothetical protein
MDEAIRYLLEHAYVVLFLNVSADQLGLPVPSVPVLLAMGDLLSLRVDQATTCPEVKRRAEAKIADIGKKIETLLEMKRALEKLTAACRKREPTGECPILEALGDE